MDFSDAFGGREAPTHTHTSTAAFRTGATFGTARVPEEPNLAKDPILSRKPSNHLAKTSGFWHKRWLERMEKQSNMGVALRFPVLSKNEIAAEILEIQVGGIIPILPDKASVQPFLAKQPTVHFGKPWKNTWEVDG